MKNKGLIFLVFALIYSANISAQILKGSSVLYFAEKGHMDAFTPNEPYGSELAFVLEDSTMYRWSRDVSEWAVVSSNKVYVISAAADTSTISGPRMNDIAYVDSTLMFLRDSAAWLLFSGGTPLPDSLVYQSELETTIDTIPSGYGTTGYLALWDAARRLGDSPVRMQGDSLIQLEKSIVLQEIISGGNGEGVDGELFRDGFNDVLKFQHNSNIYELFPRPVQSNPDGKIMTWNGVFWQESGMTMAASGDFFRPDVGEIQLNLTTDIEWKDNDYGIRLNEPSYAMEMYVNLNKDFAWRHNGVSGTTIMFLDGSSTPKLSIGASATPSYTLDLKGGTGTAIRLNPTTAPTNSEGVIYANDSDDRIRYMDGVSNNILAYKSELTTFGGYADTVAVLKETTSQSLTATASYLRITGLETTGLEEVITTTDSTLTVPVDGNYRIRYNFSIQIAAAGAGTWRFSTLAYNNAANIPETQGSVQVVTAGAETWIQPVSGETITALTAGDVISLRYTATSGPTYTLYPGTITVEKL